MMDGTANSTFAMKEISCLTDRNHAATKRDLRKSKRNQMSRKMSVSENRATDVIQIKRCSVILQKLSDKDLRKYLAAKEEPKLVQNKIQQDLRALEKAPGMKKKLEPDLKTKINIKIDPKFLATEEHLDLLMAKEMRSTYLQLEKRLNNSTIINKPNTTNNLNPVVLLKRLSPQFISHAVYGKSVKEHVAPVRTKRNSVMQRNTAIDGLRRSKRMSSCNYRHNNITILNGCRSNSFCVKRNTNTSGRHCSGQGRLSNEENIPRQKKKRSRSLSNNSDEEDFYGFEFTEKNNKNTDFMKSGTKSHLGRKTPLKAINRIETNNRVPEHIPLFKDKRIQNGLLLRSFNLAGNEKKFDELSMSHISNSEHNEIISGLPVDKLEILKLFRQREETKMLINKLIQDQNKFVRSRKKSIDGHFFSSSTLDYFSNEYYIFKAGKRRFPLWCDEHIRKVIMASQDQIPADVIDDYFPKPPSITMESLFSILT